MALWLALAAMFVCLMVLLSAALRPPGGGRRRRPRRVRGRLRLTGFPALRDRTPAGLLGANDALLKGRDVALAMPVAVTLVLAVVFLLAAAWAFRRKEL